MRPTIDKCQNCRYNIKGKFEYYGLKEPAECKKCFISSVLDTPSNFTPYVWTYSNKITREDSNEGFTIKS